MKITCPYAEAEQFTVARNNDATTLEQFSVNIVTPPGCYQWYFVTVNPGWEGVYDNGKQSVSIGNQLNARIWITDRTNLAYDESVGTAVAPSKVSLVVV